MSVSRVIELEILKKNPERRAGYEKTDHESAPASFGIVDTACGSAAGFS
jgi:hypothetical protein